MRARRQARSRRQSLPSPVLRAKRPSDPPNGAGQAAFLVYALASSVRSAAEACQWARRHRAFETEPNDMVTDFPAGGYRYIPAVFQYSGGVSALPEFAIERIRFKNPVPLPQGFERIERIIAAAGRPLTSFCACELRSPAPFSDQGFRR